VTTSTAHSRARQQRRADMADPLDVGVPPLGGSSRRAPAKAGTPTKIRSSAARSSQLQDLVHALGHVLEPLLVAAADLGGGPAVVADRGQRLEDLGPVLVA